MLRIILLAALAPSVFAQFSPKTSSTTTSRVGLGYEGYNRTSYGDPLAAVYDTLSTPSNVSTWFPAPDVYLNASVHVGEIDIEVDNITAKVNLSAKVLNLFKFNAGVDASIDRIKLTIQEVNAKVLLEARLANLVQMINDVLHSIDLNPVIATLGKDLSKTVDTATGALGQTVSGLTHPSPAQRKRELQPDYNIVHNILFSINNYVGHTHTNRVLKQDGALVDEFLDDHGAIQSEKIYGYYDREMRFNGHNRTFVNDGRTQRELEYVYEPFPGLSAICAIYVNEAGAVIRTQVLSESMAGGSSTIGQNT